MALNSIPLRSKSVPFIFGFHFAKISIDVKKVFLVKFCKQDERTWRKGLLNEVPSVGVKATHKHCNNNIELLRVTGQDNASPRRVTHLCLKEGGCFLFFFSFLLQKHHFFFLLVTSLILSLLLPPLVGRSLVLLHLADILLLEPQHQVIKRAPNALQLVLHRGVLL